MATDNVGEASIAGPSENHNGKSTSGTQAAQLDHPNPQEDGNSGNNVQERDRGDASVPTPPRIANPLDDVSTNDGIPQQTCGCSRVTSRTHVPKDHIPEWETFEKDIQSHLKGLAFKPRQYDRIRVASVHWKESDIPLLKDHADELRSVLSGIYGYEMDDAYVLDNDKSAKTIQRGLINFLNREGEGISSNAEYPNNLFILHYVGHGGRSKSEPPEYFWQPKKDSTQENLLKWPDLQHTLSNIECDILLLFDCCHAGGMIGDHVNWHYRCELLGSSGANETASAPGKSRRTEQVKRGEAHSFTSAIAERLRIHGNQPGMVVSYFANYMRSTEMAHHYGLLPEPTYRMLHDASKPDFHSSIFLQSKHFTPTSTPDSGVSFPMLTQEMNALNNLRMIITLRFTNPAEKLLPKDYFQMFERLPHNIAGIDIKLQCHGLWRGNSSLVIVSVPMWVWDLLPKTSRYQSIGMVCSDDLMPTLASTEQNHGAPCDPTQKEILEISPKPQAPSSRIDELLERASAAPNDSSSVPTPSPSSMRPERSWVQPSSPPFRRFSRDAPLSPFVKLDHKVSDYQILRTVARRTRRLDAPWLDQRSIGLPYRSSAFPRAVAV